MEGQIVLVIDDDRTNLTIVHKILESRFRVAMANSMGAAMKYLERNIPDLILMDLNMPDMSGFEAIKLLKEKEQYAAVPIIFLTADVEFKTQKQCMQAGAAEFIGKPFVPEILLNRVGRILELEHYHKLEAAKAQQ